MGPEDVIPAHEQPFNGKTWDVMPGRDFEERKLNFALLRWGKFDPALDNPDEWEEQCDARAERFEAQRIIQEGKERRNREIRKRREAMREDCLRRYRIAREQNLTSYYKFAKLAGVDRATFHTFLHALRKGKYRLVSAETLARIDAALKILGV